MEKLPSRDEIPKLSKAKLLEVVWEIDRRWTALNKSSAKGSKKDLKRRLAEALGRIEEQRQNLTAQVAELTKKLETRKGVKISELEEQLADMTKDAKYWEEEHNALYDFVESKGLDPMAASIYSPCLFCGAHGWKKDGHKPGCAVNSKKELALAA